MLSRIKFLFKVSPLHSLIEVVISTSIIGWLCYSFVNDYTIEYNLSVLFLMFGIDFCNGYLGKAKLKKMFEK